MKLYELTIEKPKITSGFGYRSDPKTHKKTYHAGIDLISTVGNRNLFAVDDGYVQKVVNNQSKSKTGYGNYIWVRYPRYNLSLLYGHRASVKKKKGDKVKKGDVIAIEGSTGKSTGVHLHLGITKIGSDTWLNPTKFNVLSDKFNLTRILKPGCKCDDVKELQRKLKSLGYDLGKYGNNKDGIDGVFGDKNSKTSIAVRNFQKKNKLKVYIEVGKKTAHKLGWLYKGK